VREVRPQGSAAVPSDAIDDGTVVRGPAAPPAREAEAGEPDGIAVPSRRGRAVVVAITAAASVALVAAVGAAVALGGSIGGPGGAEPATTDAPSEDAVIAARVPAPEVGDGVARADGTVVFPVSHDDAEEGDRYRWRRADGSGATDVAAGPEIVVAGVSAGSTVCIEVQVQRGSKTSEPVTGCSR
jgi:hypothetical protein